MNGYLPVIAILRASGPVGLLIGGSGTQTAKVFPGDLPQKAVFPCISVDTYDGEPFDTKDGVSVVDHDLVKVMCFAETDSAAYQLATACRNALDGISGTYNGYYVENVRWLRPSSYDIDATNKRIRVHEHDYEVRIRIDASNLVGTDIIIEDEGSPI